ncbi:hypothetical protein ACKKBF_B02955 [Auxenochlorella protothecoides x Auxenochlorella symbiontica]
MMSGSLVPCGSLPRDAVPFRAFPRAGPHPVPRRPILPEHRTFAVAEATHLRTLEPLGYSNALERLEAGWALCPPLLIPGEEEGRDGEEGREGEQQRPREKERPRRAEPKKKAAEVAPARDAFLDDFSAILRDLRGLDTELEASNSQLQSEVMGDALTEADRIRLRKQVRAELGTIQTRRSAAERGLTPTAPARASTPRPRSQTPRAAPLAATSSRHRIRPTMASPRVARAVRRARQETADAVPAGELVRSQRSMRSVGAARSARLSRRVAAAGGDAAAALFPALLAAGGGGVLLESAQRVASREDDEGEEEEEEEEEDAAEAAAGASSEAGSDSRRPALLDNDEDAEDGDAPPLTADQDANDEEEGAATPAAALRGDPCACIETMRAVLASVSSKRLLTAAQECDLGEMVQARLGLLEVRAQLRAARGEGGGGLDPQATSSGPAAGDDGHATHGAAPARSCPAASASHGDPAASITTARAPPAVSPREWAAAAGLTPAELQMRLHLGLQAREMMVACNARLVAAAAHRYTGRGLSHSDLVSEGMQGLRTGVERFDPRRGFRLSTYVTWWIRQALGRATQAQGRLVSLPVSVVDRFRRLVRAEVVLCDQLGRPPTQDELAAAAGMSAKRLVQVQAAIRKPAVLNEAEGDRDEEGGLQPSAAFVIDSTEDPMLRAMQALKRVELDDVLRGLPRREVSVIKNRFGLEDGRERTLGQCGTSHEVHITRERVRQIEAKAIHRLRSPSRFKRLEGDW